MKKSILCLLIILLTNSSVQALSWAYPFVVWKGKVYEVTEEKVNTSLIGRKIGEVKTKPHEMTGSHYGNASNYFPIGTEYFEISGISTKTAIAVQAGEGEWVKAVFTGKTSFHWMDLFNNIFPALILLVIVLFFVRQSSKLKSYQGE
ncbi:hypothetical protein [Sporosarcina highlanderae]|uniref:DUF3592 domain-containing protein n=1 Tax=Sporosarcina highlanderae TaxID=3035916 RepID=A0ABT8JR95_9BACL|nr:hypothetical protein [Sporosarcina highlanderae]MDN4607674.1 hypothetical protein [Sporosarcina highlanderae]